MAKKEMGDVSPMIDELILQHDRIKGDLKGLTGSIKTGDANLENDLEQLLAAHDKMEEEDMYPWIDNNIDDKIKKEALSKIA